MSNNAKLNEEELKRYSKQILIKNLGGPGQLKLKNTKIIVIGAGGLGAPVIMHLSSIGIGCIGIVDFDEVDISNLQRQFIHNVNRVGLPKVDSAKTFVSQLNPNILVNTYQIDVKDREFKDVISKYDIVVDCTDNFNTRFRVADLCQELKKPYIFGSVRAFEGQITSILPSNNELKYPKIRDLFDEETLEDNQETCADVGILSITTTLVGTIMGGEAIKISLGFENTLVGKLLVVDLLNNKFETFIYDSH